MTSVAIDGPAGAGKSTIARAAAKQLGFIYVDTGALYRTIGYACLKRGISPRDSAAVEGILPELQIALRFLSGEQHTFLNEEDVSELIRTEEVSMAASHVSAIPAVRAFLLDLQRDFAKTQSVVMDGRDIGTVVLPHADVKVFLTASAEARAHRRWLQYREKGISADEQEILREIRQRDENDSGREIAPLRRAEDAALLDTTELTLEESISQMISLIRSKIS